MEERRVINILVKLYNEYQHYLTSEDKKGRKDYDKEVDSLYGFITYLFNIYQPPIE